MEAVSILPVVYTGFAIMVIYFGILYVEPYLPVSCL
jgi:hypothetical protein